jgi:hypothetical protein
MKAAASCLTLTQRSWDLGGYRESIRSKVVKNWIKADLQDMVVSYTEKTQIVRRLLRPVLILRNDYKKAKIVLG